MLIVFLFTSIDLCIEQQAPFFTTERHIESIMKAFVIGRKHSGPEKLT